MITALLLLSLTFYQNAYTYDSDIVWFETEKNYVLCRDSFESPCPSETDKTLKKITGEETGSLTKSEITGAKSESHRKITLPIIEDMKNHRFVQKDSGPIEKTTIPANSKGHEPLPLKRIKQVSDSPFAIKPHGYYDPEKSNEFLSKLEEDKPLEKTTQVISSAEVNFMIDEQGLYISSADRQMLEAMGERYHGHLLRFQGYGLDKDEAEWMILSVMEVLVPEEIEEIQTYRDENQRLVIVEVLNEI